MRDEQPIKSCNNTRHIHSSQRRFDSNSLPSHPARARPKRLSPQPSQSQMGKKNAPQTVKPIQIDDSFLKKSQGTPRERTSWKKHESVIERTNELCSRFQKKRRCDKVDLSLHTTTHRPFDAKPRRRIVRTHRGGWIFPIGVVRDEKQTRQTNIRKHG